MKEGKMSSLALVIGLIATFVFMYYVPFKLIYSGIYYGKMIGAEMFPVKNESNFDKINKKITSDNKSKPLMKMDISGIDQASRERLLDLFLEGARYDRYNHKFILPDGKEIELD